MPCSCYLFKLITDNCQLLAKLPILHQSSPTLISVHPNRHLAISTSPSEAVLWDTEAWDRKRVLEGFGGEGVQQTAFSPDGLMICAAFQDGSIFFWSIDTFSLIWKIQLSSLANPKPESHLEATEFSATMLKSLKLPRITFFDLSNNGEFFIFV
jgi:WD40 repeat protein